MTTTADSKKRVVLPTASRGERLTRAQCLRAIRVAPLRQKLDSSTFRQIDPRAMILLDTNVLIYAFDNQSKYSQWARRVIAEGVSGEEAAVNAVSLAGVCVGDAEPQTVTDRIRSWGVSVLNVSVAASEVCVRTSLDDRARRKAEFGREAPALPLPDFFIDAHAQIMRWTLATADAGRFKTYFPTVPLRSSVASIGPLSDRNGIVR